MQAKDIMSKKIIAMNPKTTIKKAIDILIDNKISGAPVCREDGTLVGVISEKDLMVPLDLIYGQKKEEDACVEAIMAQNVITFDEDAPVEKIMETLITENIKRVPIIKITKLLESSLVVIF